MMANMTAMGGMCEEAIALAMKALDEEGGKKFKSVNDDDALPQSDEEKKAAEEKSEKSKQTLDFVTKTEDLLSFLLPNYLDEGKTDLVIAVGCTGGKHRSVCIAKELSEFVRKKGYATVLSHRDMGRR